MQEMMVYVLMGGLGIIIIVLMVSFVYPYFRIGDLYGISVN